MGKDRPTKLIDVSSTTEFQVQVKNTWSKEMRLNSLRLHLKPLQNKETITLKIFNDQDELVCSPQIDTNNYGNPDIITTTNLNRPDMISTGELRMERDIMIPSGGTCLFRVTFVGSDARAEVWNEYLAYSAMMSEISAGTSDAVFKELARIENELANLSIRTSSKENDLHIQSKANSDLMIQKLVECELLTLSQGATARADILIQALQSMR